MECEKSVGDALVSGNALTFRFALGSVKHHGSLGVLEGVAFRERADERKKQAHARNLSYALTTIALKEELVTLS